MRRFSTVIGLLSGGICLWPCLFTGTVVTLAARPGAAWAQQPLNLDFETPSVAGYDRPWGWTFGWSAFGGQSNATFAMDSLVSYSGRRSLRIALPDSGAAEQPESITLQVPAAFALGRELRLTGWMRAEAMRGRALLTLEAWKDRAFAAADTVVITGTAGRDWTQRQLIIRVPPNSEVHSVVITAALQGPGTVWFDDLKLAVDGVQVTALPIVPDPPSPSDLAWLAEHVTPLRHVEPAPGDIAGDADLALFADIVGDANVVALGESTHGTREFFLAKHRLFEYLVCRAGFTLFAIEANQIAVERINRYVHGGPGTAQEAMRAMFAVWNTEEVLALVEWMRAHNASSPGNTVRFTGFDMQDHRAPFDSLSAFLNRMDPALAARVEALAGDYRAQPSWATPHLPDTTRARWHRQAEALFDLVNDRRNAWLSSATSAADTAATEWAVQAANLLRQAAMLNGSLASPDRDSLMAANLDWALRTLAPGARAVVWGHDVHVSRGGDRHLSFNGGSQMGAFLSRWHGDAYRAFSLLTYEGTYSATRSFSDHRMIEAEAFPAPPNSLEGALHALDVPPGGIGFIVDLRPARTGAASAWLRQPRPIRHVGFAAYDYGFELNAVLPLEFDGVVFVTRTGASRLLRR